MKTALKFAFIALVAFSFTLCSPKQKKETNNNEVTVGNFDWLIGNWKRTNDAEGRQTFEVWEKLNENQYSGIGYTLQNGDTISQELMNLLKKENNWNFIVKVHSENEPTIFNLANYNDSSFTCTNDSIDFPKMIKYWKEGAKLNALVTGDSLELAFDFEPFE